VTFHRRLDFAQRGRGQILQVAELRCGNCARTVTCRSECTVTTICTWNSDRIPRGARLRCAPGRAKGRNNGQQRDGQCHYDAHVAAYIRPCIHIILRYAETVAGSTVTLRGVQFCGVNRYLSFVLPQRTRSSVRCSSFDSCTNFRRAKHRGLHGGVVIDDVHHGARHVVINFRRTVYINRVAHDEFETSLGQLQFCFSGGSFQLRADGTGIRVVALDKTLEPTGKLNWIQS